ncbi:serine hydrolase [Clostridium coskatii]|uniref:Penicillin-binding protein 4 n=1 Tax=Clostridium coskatii TaxID=1705578 RepID=A0A166TEI6_9CLOT|nr:serine hydrolase [Clostridium coskatii]OAA93581.1 Penicillin-binding protein 4* [Clostridium coskatii]OBR94444.1 penicillin-binding protein 4* [Clostridium coskatii]
MIKKVFSCILISTFLVFSNAAIVSVNASPAITTKSTSDVITVSMDGTNVSSKDGQPYQDSNSIVMVPLNAVIQKLGNNSNIQIKDGSAALTTSDFTIKLENNNKKVIINNEVFSLSTAPIIKGATVFVPLEFFSQFLGKTIDWDSSAKTAKILTPAKNTEEYFQSVVNSTRYLNTSQKLDNYLSLLQSADNFHGSVLVAQDGNILIDKGYGKADAEQNIKNTPQTEFPIGSMTKQFTAMAIMQLVEKGLINENDPLSKYVPDFPKGDTITIKNLLTHTSGIQNCTNFPEFWSMKLDSFKDINNVINLFKNKPLEFTPGTDFDYTNSGYILLGYIVTKVSGMSYIDYLQKNIFDPLNMKSTGLGYNGADKMYTSTGYSGYLDQYPISDEITLNGAYGAGALYSTTEDLYKWDRALYTEKLVKQSTLKKIFTNYVQMSKNGPYYGYGWMLTDGKYGREIYHGGNVLGFTGNIARYPDKDLTIIMLTNVGYYNVNSLNDALSNICMGGSYELPSAKQVVKVDSKTLDKYAGNYAIPGGLNISITSNGSHLYYEQDGSKAKYQLFPESQNKFFLRVSNVEIKFNVNVKDQTTGLDLYQLGEDIQIDKSK